MEDVTNVASSAFITVIATLGTKVFPCNPPLLSPSCFFSPSSSPSSSSALNRVHQVSLSSLWFVMQIHPRKRDISPDALLFSCNCNLYDPFLQPPIRLVLVVVGGIGHPRKRVSCRFVPDTGYLRITLTFLFLITSFPPPTLFSFWQDVTTC